MTMTEKLLSQKDCWYHDFQSRLMPGVQKEKIIGVRVPKIRKIAKEASYEEQILEEIKKREL